MIKCRNCLLSGRHVTISYLGMPSLAAHVRKGGINVLPHVSADRYAQYARQREFCWLTASHTVRGVSVPTARLAILERGAARAVRFGGAPIVGVS